MNPNFPLTAITYISPALQRGVERFGLGLSLGMGDRSTDLMCRFRSVDRVSVEHHC